MSENVACSCMNTHFSSSVRPCVCVCLCLLSVSTVVLVLQLPVHRQTPFPTRSCTSGVIFLPPLHLPPFFCFVLDSFVLPNGFSERMVVVVKLFSLSMQRSLVCRGRRFDRRLIETHPLTVLLLFSLQILPTSAAAAIPIKDGKKDDNSQFHY